jgi:hypothetical protein
MIMPLLASNMRSLVGARMQYPKFRKQHLFVGSGVIEAGCKTVIGQRFKQSGMFWSVKGANSILALRCHAVLRKKFVRCEIALRCYGNVP